MDRPTMAARRDVFCARCDAPNAADARYCEGCGAELTANGGSTAPQRSAQGRRCCACGIANPAGALYCVNCGVPLASGSVAASPPPAYAPAAPALALAGGAPGGTIVQHIYVSMPPAQAELPLLARALWFVFVGLWVGQIWLIVAWLLNLTLIGLPLGMWMLNALPQVMTLRQRRGALRLPSDRSGASFAVRAVYFVLIGWWLSLLWMELAWLAAGTVIGLPLAFLMFERVGTLTTLAEA